MKSCFLIDAVFSLAWSCWDILCFLKKLQVLLLCISPWCCLSRCASSQIHRHQYHIPSEIQSFELSADNKLGGASYILPGGRDIWAFQKEFQIWISLTAEQFALCLGPFERSFGPETMVLFQDHFFTYGFFDLYLAQWTVFLSSCQFFQSPYNFRPRSMILKLFVFTSENLCFSNMLFLFLLPISQISCKMFLQLFPFSSAYF